MGQYLRYGLLLAVLLAAAAVYWRAVGRQQLSMPADSPSQAETAGLAVDGETVPDEGDKANDVEPARRIQSGAQEASADSAAGSKAAATDRDEAADADRAVERVSAFLEERDLALAMAVQESIAECRGIPLSDSEWDRVESAFAAMQSDLNQPLEAVDAMADTIERAKALRARCGKLAQLRSGSVLEDLSERAANGDPYARYLYAIWPPYMRASLGQAVEPLLQYETTALDYSLDNLREGHPLGFLALGLSYFHGDFFTPRRHELGVALMVAADLCSNGTLEIDGWVNMTDQWDQPWRALYGQGITGLEILETGARLHDTYCATSVSNKLD
jgi:hypothetical protein